MIYFLIFTIVISFLVVRKEIAGILLLWALDEKSTIYSTLKEDNDGGILFSDKGFVSTGSLVEDIKLLDYKNYIRKHPNLIFTLYYKLFINYLENPKIFNKLVNDNLVTTEEFPDSWKAETGSSFIKHKKFKLTPKGKDRLHYIKFGIFGTIFFQLSGVLLNNWFAN